MEKKKLKLPNAHIILYQEDFDWDIWCDYCDIANQPHNSKWITIYFNTEDTEADN